MTNKPPRRTPLVYIEHDPIDFDGRCFIYKLTDGRLAKLPANYGTPIKFREPLVLGFNKAQASPWGLPL